jgi:hypothetical protein
MKYFPTVYVGRTTPFCRLGESHYADNHTLGKDDDPVCDECGVAVEGTTSDHMTTRQDIVVLLCLKCAEHYHRIWTMCELTGV